MFDDWKAEVEQQYQTLDYDLGWAMFGTPATRILSARYAVIGLNPGNDHFGAPVWEQEGNLLFSDEYRSQFFTQSRRAFREIGWGPDDFFYAQFIPFRSPSINSLPKANLAYKFSLDLWKKISPYVAAQVILALGHDSADAMAKVFNAQRPGRKVGPFRVYEVGNDRRIIEIPHPSRAWTFSEENAVENGEILRSLVHQIIQKP